LESRLFCPSLVRGWFIRVRVCPNRPIVVFQALGSDSRWKGVVASSTSNWKHQGIGRLEGKLHDALIVDDSQGWIMPCPKAGLHKRAGKSCVPLLFGTGRAVG